MCSANRINMLVEIPGPIYSLLKKRSKTFSLIGNDKPIKLKVFFYDKKGRKINVKRTVKCIFSYICC